MKLRTVLHRLCRSSTIARMTPAVFRGIMLRLWYRSMTGKWLHLRHPKTFGEKIQWLKLHPAPLATVLADKYAVRKYVADTIGEQYLVPLVGNNGGVWEKAEDIDFDSLPDRFVLKCNHGSGYNIIVTDKSKLDIPATRATLNGWLQENYSYRAGMEMQYRDIPRRIVAEQYLPPESAGIEIQAYTFGGKVRFLSYESCKDSEDTYRYVVDTNWNPMGFQISPQHYSPFDEPPEKPDFLEEFIQVAEKLAHGQLHVRVDFAVSGHRLLFRELTFTSGSGLSVFSPSSAALVVGEMFHLPDEG